MQAVARATASAETALKVASEGITKGIQGVLPESKVIWPLHVGDGAPRLVSASSTHGGLQHVMRVAFAPASSQALAPYVV
jgi:hypothetical protein